VVPCEGEDGRQDALGGPWALSSVRLGDRSLDRATLRSSADAQGEEQHKGEESAKVQRFHAAMR
jgi:hypothetical protein